MIGEQDAQETTDLALAQQPLRAEEPKETPQPVDSEAEEEEEELLPPRRNRPRSDDSDLYGFPITAEDLEGARNYWMDITGGRELVDPEAMMDTRNAMSNTADEDELELRMFSRRRRV